MRLCEPPFNDSQLAAIETARRMLVEHQVSVKSLEPTVRDFGDRWAIIFEYTVVMDPSIVVVDVNKLTGQGEFFPMD